MSSEEANTRADETMPQLGPMEITEKEREWAVSIKEAVERDDAVTNLNDMEYVQHAVIAMEKLGKAVKCNKRRQASKEKQGFAEAVKRVKLLQGFKEKHGITGDGNAVAGIELVDKLLIQKHPGLYVSARKLPTGQVAQIMDYTKFFPATQFLTEDDWKDYFHALYYLYGAMHCDVAAMREGAVMIGLWQGLGWKNFSLEMERQATEFTSEIYPYHTGQIFILDPPKIISFMFRFLVKPFLSKKLKERFHITTTPAYLRAFPDMLPVDALPDSTLKERFAELITLRHDNAASFKL